MPEAALGLARSVMLPGHVAKGGKYSGRDVTEMAGNIAAGGLLGSAPNGALAISLARYAKKNGMEISSPEEYQFSRPSWDKTKDDVMSVFRNPTEAQVAKAVKDKKYMRVLLDRDSGDFLVWPGNEGLHADIIKKLNLSDDKIDNLGSIKSFDDLKKLVEWVGAKKD